VRGAWRVSYIPTTKTDHDRAPIHTQPYRHPWSATRRAKRLRTLGATHVITFYDTGWEWA
jgi:hypothetical protein